MIRKVRNFRQSKTANAPRRPELTISMVSLLVSTATALFIAFYQVSYTENAEKKRTNTAIREGLYDIYVCMKKENLEISGGEGETKCTPDEVRKQVFRYDGNIDLSNDKTVTATYRRYTEDLLSFAAISVATSVGDKSWPQSLMNVRKYLDRLNAQHAVIVTALSLCNFTDIREDEIRFEDALFLFPEQMPFQFERITSYYHSGRYNPILGAFRAHKGIDYGGPEGTPIHSTISGTIAFAGTNGGYGTAVEVRSSASGKVRTYYAHLQRVADGITVGTKVSAGDVIGYLGQTGLVTGPLLHYEWRVGDQQLPPPLITQKEILNDYQKAPRSKMTVDSKILRRLTIPN